jgi:hypothetical protein
LDPLAVLQVMNSLVFFKDHPTLNYSIDTDRLRPRVVNDEVNRRMAYFLGSW